MLNSTLFAKDPLLAGMARDADRQRISKTRNRTGPAVRKIQQALLRWEPDCLPRFGADGDYGDETNAAACA